MIPLSELRDRWLTVNQNAANYEAAAEAKKREAAAIAAAISGDSGDSGNNEDFENLETINSVFLLIMADHDAAVADREKTEALIDDYYHLASDKFPDWRLKLHEGQLYSGWGSSWSAGNILLIDRELCPYELLLLGNMVLDFHGKPSNLFRKITMTTGTERNPIPSGWLRINARYDAYRGMCPTDFNGDHLLKSFGRLLPGFTEKQEKLSDRLASLEVLKG